MNRVNSFDDDGIKREFIACIHRGEFIYIMRPYYAGFFLCALVHRVVVAPLVVEIPGNGLLCRLPKVRFPWTVSPVQSCCHEEGHGEGDPVFVWHAEYILATTFLKHKTFDIRKLSIYTSLNICDGYIYMCGNYTLQFLHQSMSNIANDAKKAMKESHIVVCR